MLMTCFSPQCWACNLHILQKFLFHQLGRPLCHCYYYHHHRQRHHHHRHYHHHCNHQHHHHNHHHHQCKLCRMLVLSVKTSSSPVEVADIVGEIDAFMFLVDGGSRLFRNFIKSLQAAFRHSINTASSRVTA